MHRAVRSVLAPYLPWYREDRSVLPLWTYQPAAWDTYSVPWPVRVMWSPRVRARTLVGEASGYWRYLKSTELEGKRVKWIESFGSWPKVTVKLGPPSGEAVGTTTVEMPRILQAHLLGLYAVTGEAVPEEAEQIELPEHPDQPDVRAFLTDAREALEQLYAELESIFTNDPEFAERLHQDFGRRIARDSWWQKWLADARDLLDPEEHSEKDEYHLREELQSSELISELLTRMQAWPSLQGDRKIVLQGEPLLRLNEEAEQLVDRHWQWKPDAERVAALINLIIEDPVWSLQQSAEHRLHRWRERLRRSDGQSVADTLPDGPLPRSVVDYAHWLRFPYLPSPRPGPVGHEDGRKRRKAPRWLLRNCLPGPPKDSTLENYLSEARSSAE